MTDASLGATAPTSLIPASRGRVGDHPIFVLHAEATRRAAAGESIVNATLGALTTDEGTLAVLPSVLEAFADAQARRAAGYAPISGRPEFRRAVIDSLFAETPLADRAVAVATPGGTGAIYQAMVNFLEPGQRLLTTQYFWGPYRDISMHSGRGIDTFALFGADGGFDTAALAEGMERHAAEQGRVFLVMNFPCHNPTGYSLSPEEWDEVATVVRRVGARVPVTVLIDAAYLHYAGDGRDAWVPAAEAMLEAATVLVAWTASKAFTQYGSRTGALVALHRDDAERTQIANALGYTSRATWSNCSHVGQIAVTRLLTDPDLATRCDTERQALTDTLQQRIDVFKREATAAGLDFPRYDAGFFVAVFTPDAATTARVMREAGVYTVPIDGAVRVGLCCTPAADVPRLVEALVEGVAAVPAA
ncbi:MAG: aminotransferase class I/II-fold pyridoxal phosphate-dependent enzyme [Gemmatimonadetes bacterium]|nr:aminotransferase class I/II-fold pyridoxal phosphate-dependent enzyme [Gemmatimonadota bacterium]